MNVDGFYNYNINSIPIVLAVEWSADLISSKFSFAKIFKIRIWPLFLACELDYHDSYRIKWE